MRALRFFSCTTAAVALLTAAPLFALPAFATTEGPYVGLNAGLSLFNDADAERGNATNELSYDPGYAFGGSAGYAWANGLRLEGELGYHRAGIDSIDGAGSGPAHDGSMRAFTAMANVLYDIGTWSRVTPYIGAGVGYAHVSADNVHSLFSGVTLDDGSSRFAYQGIVGASFEMDRNWALTADYRYLGTTDADMNASTGADAETEFSSHNIMMGVRYTWGAAPAKAAPVETPEPAAPRVDTPAIPMEKPTYMVFFDWDQAVLTPEAKKILASVAQAYKAGHSVTIKVTGHADRSGPDKYNQKLSERRAEAVRAELARLGLAKNEIVARGMGEAAPLVPTADGVREAQNRRAEIVMDDRR